MYTGSHKHILFRQQKAEIIHIHIFQKLISASLTVKLGKD